MSTDNNAFIVVLPKAHVLNQHVRIPSWTWANGVDVMAYALAGDRMVQAVVINMIERIRPYSYGPIGSGPSGPVACGEGRVTDFPQSIG